MTIRLLDPEDSAAMDQWYELMVAVGRHDLPGLPAPSRRQHLGRFERPAPEVSEEVLVAWDGGRVVGVASYQLPQLENLGLVYLELMVHPRYRRRGVGSGLLEGVYAAARRRGRRLIEVQAVRGLPGGVARDEAGYRYLTGRGHRAGSTSLRSHCWVADRSGDDEELLAEAWTHAEGYSLVQWRDVAPDDVVEDVAALQSRLMVDAPSGELAVEQQVYDVGRVRRQEASELSRGYRSYSTAARCDATGQVVARTKLAFETEDDARARQRVTIVEPAHRGRRLGLIVKAANHAYARSQEPPLRVIESWNAEDNTHMRAVNALLGFHAVDSWSVFQFPVPSA
ncbi:GNAT family N-acetyltransferase [Kribbella sp. NPDC056951]|uniref:GNAT family N-acetyltransferase n=1 Tax=Kribbella sp. NPDC056951 TaxID=3345978 RepID=UPI00363DC6D9